MFHKPKVVSLSSNHRLPAPPLLSPLFNLFLSCTLTIRCWFAIPPSHLHTQNRTYRYTHCSCWRFCQLFSIFAILSIIVNKLYIFYTFSSPKNKNETTTRSPCRTRAGWIMVAYVANAECQQSVLQAADQAADEHSTTFVIGNEDHTLGNSLRYYLQKNPEVEFCGYGHLSIHPSSCMCGCVCGYMLVEFCGHIHLRGQSSWCLQLNVVV